MSEVIPIQNLYYLFCYAWRHYQEGKRIDVGRVSNPTLPNLFATVLIEGVQRLLRRGLERDYKVLEDDLTCIRGKIDISNTIKKSLLLDSKVACQFDELSADTAANRVLKATIISMVRTQGVDPELRKRLQRIHREFSLISDLPLDRALFRQVKVHRNNRAYAFLMRVCEFVRDSLIPDPSSQKHHFPDILREEQRMAQVFEEFVRNFLSAEQSNFRVSRDRIYWSARELRPGSISHLPSMNTDISLRNSERAIIIDTKYYRQALQEHYGRETVRSDNLYQLYAYLKNLETKGGVDAFADGVLLYPSTGRDFDFRYQFPGHAIRVTTVDLTQDWTDIRKQLLGLVDQVSEAPC